MARRRSRVLGMIMAGGKGERLHPLTRDRSKPSVPFGGRYRIVDFVLSNFVNSEMAALYVLVQYKSQSLIEHLRQAWRTSGILPDYFITVVPPQMRFGPAWYRGTADAVLQNLNVVDDFNPDIVAIFGADHVYRMDINQMLVFHEESGADPPAARGRARHDFGRSTIPRLGPRGRGSANASKTTAGPGAKPYGKPANWRAVGAVRRTGAAPRPLVGKSPRFGLATRSWPI